MNFVCRACLLFLLVALSSCRQDHYGVDQVTIKSQGYTNKGIVLEFATPPETLYYCPGINLEYHGTQVRYTYVRAHIDNSPEVDAPARQRKGNNVVVVPFPGNETSIELIDPAGKSLGAWRLTDQR